jgi:hypothetical protein
MIFAIVIIGIVAVAALIVAIIGASDADDITCFVKYQTETRIGDIGKRVSELEETSARNGFTVGGLMSAEGDFSNRLEALEEWFNIEYSEPEEVVGKYRYRGEE